jgi:curved DNA-binding protein CbpA
MNIKEALQTLEISSVLVSNLTLESLKKKYHKMALANHPDKNGNTPESTQQFQRIQEAYDLLKREISNSEINNNNNTWPEDTDKTGYTEILHLFIDGILKGKYNEFISSIVKDIVTGCKEISIKLFEGMTKEQSLSIYNFILKYKQLMRLDDATLEKVREIIVSKFSDVQIYILNPSINDLFQNNVYKLEIDRKIYFVPLWHNELHFESDIIVKCNPDLPPNVEIDEDNNLIITERILITSITSSLFKSPTRNIKVGDYSFELPLDQLYLRPFQTYILRKKGISKISETDIYEIEDKADIIIKIIFE